MTLDFRASQLRTNKLVASGSTGVNAKLVIYPFSSALNLSGGIDSSKFNTSSIGTDIFVFFSGSLNSLNTSNSFGVAAFGGDVHISGNLQAQQTIISNTIYNSGNLFVSGNADIQGVISGSSGSFKTLFVSGNAQMQGTVNFSETSFFTDFNGGNIQLQGNLSSVTGDFVDLTIYNNLVVEGRISGSLQHLSNGTSYLREGVGVYINSVSNGPITLSSSAGVYGRLNLSAYSTTTNTSSNPLVCGQNEWAPSDWGFGEVSSSVVFKAILSCLSSGETAFVSLYNASTAGYVHIGGPGVTVLSTSLQTPTKLTSVNLSGATNFSTSSAQIYEVQLYSSTGSNSAFLGSAEFLTRL